MKTLYKTIVYLINSEKKNEEIIFTSLTKEKRWQKNIIFKK